MRNSRCAINFSSRVFITGLVMAAISLGGLYGQDASSPSPPTIYIIGDSTASNSRDLGWGSHLGKFFAKDELRVVNRARGGRSSRTFRSEKLWERVTSDLKAGDFVLIQFGHNDGGKPGAGKDRGSLRGTGEETVEVKGETVHTFGWYLRQYIREARTKGATPVVLSLTVRNEWKDGKVERGPGSYSKWSEEVARAERAKFVDLNNIIGLTYERMGKEAVAPLFPKDHTHTSAEGAALNARSVVAGLKALSGQPFDDGLTESGHQIAPDAAGKRAPFPTPGKLNPNYQEVLPTVFFIGDSTVKNGRDVGSDGLWGWAHPVATLFDRTRINVENQALGGTSSRTYRSAGHWGNVIQHVKKGDFVVMQFGHNDSSPINDKSRARGTIKSNGDEVKEITNLLTDETETVHSYGWYLRQFVAEVKAKGATAIICSPVPRNSFREGRVRRLERSYALWARQAAEDFGAPFVKLNALIADRYDELGEEKVRAFFPKDHTHTGWEGSRVNAAIAAEAIRKLDGCKLKNYLR